MSGIDMVQIPTMAAVPIALRPRARQCTGMGAPVAATVSTALPFKG